jgi:hypothetical protein
MLIQARRRSAERAQSGKAGHGSGNQGSKESPLSYVGITAFPAHALRAPNTNQHLADPLQRPDPEIAACTNTNLPDT